MSDASIRSESIRLSLRAFVGGLFGLLPLVGIPAALFAIVCWAKTLRRLNPSWNPGSRYLYTGLGFALAGICISLLASLALLIWASNALQLFDAID
jgi:hypothetical protein